MASKRSPETSDPLLREMLAIKRLLVLHLLKAGASQTEIGHALGIDQSAVSRMFASCKVRKYGA